MASSLLPNFLFRMLHAQKVVTSVWSLPERLLTRFRGNAESWSTDPHQVSNRTSVVAGRVLLFSPHYVSQCLVVWALRARLHGGGLKVAGLDWCRCAQGIVAR